MESTPNHSTEIENGSSNRRYTNTTFKYFVSMSKGQVALLSQSDSFFSMLTPRETLDLATFLQLDIHTSDRERIIDQTLDQLGLKHVESRKIGDAGIGNSDSGSSGGGRGDGGSLSGGERRRLSVGKSNLSRLL